MKKILFITAVAVLALSAVSCKKKGTNEPDDPQSPSQDTTQVNPSGSGLNISVSDIDANEATVSVTSSDPSATFYFTCYEKSVLSAYSDKEIVSNVVIGEMDYILDLYSQQGITYSDLLSSGSDSYTFSDLDANTEYWAIAAYVNADGKSDGVLYKKAFTTKQSGSGSSSSGNGKLDYDTDSQGFSENFTSYTVDKEYLDNYSIIFVNAENNNGGFVGLEFFVPETATDLVAGDYTISDSMSDMTVMASEGVDDEGYVTYSLAGYLDQDEYITDVWFLVSGTVSVKSNGTISINGVNSYGKAVKCTLTGRKSSAPAKMKRALTASSTSANGFRLSQRPLARPHFISHYTNFPIFR
jgi:hypothetical protein